jgi:molybdopterin synthase sulfur carrier subunit
VAAPTTVTVRYFAGARAAAGVDTETRTAATLEELVGQIVDAHGERLERVLTACSFLVDGTQTRNRALVLEPGVVVDVLPPEDDPAPVKALPHHRSSPAPPLTGRAPARRRTPAVR